MYSFTSAIKWSSLDKQGLPVPFMKIHWVCGYMSYRGASTSPGEGLFFSNPSILSARGTKPNSDPLPGLSYAHSAWHFEEVWTHKPGPNYQWSPTASGYIGIQEPQRLSEILLFLTQKNAGWTTYHRLFCLPWAALWQWLDTPVVRQICSPAFLFVYKF